MYRISTTSASLAVIALGLAALAGCPFLDTDSDDTGDDGSGGDTSASTIAGTWSGTLDCTTTFSYPDLPGEPLPYTRDLTITFSNEYLPSSLPVWGFNLAFDQRTTAYADGESQTFTFDANNPPGRSVTLVVTATAASYTESGAQVVMDLQHSAECDELTEEGTGTMTIDATVDGDTLTFSAVAEYAVTQTTDQTELEATETINCTGTLDRQ